MMVESKTGHSLAPPPAAVERGRRAEGGYARGTEAMCSWPSAYQQLERIEILAQACREDTADEDVGQGPRDVSHLRK